MPLGSNVVTPKPKREQKPSAILLKDLYEKPEPEISVSVLNLKRESKKCCICGLEFIPKQRKQVTCGKLECQRQNTVETNRIQAEQKSQREFSKGLVYVLDEETWTWKKEKRG